MRLYAVVAGWVRTQLEPQWKHLKSHKDRKKKPRCSLGLLFRVGRQAGWLQKPLFSPPLPFPPHFRLSILRREREIVLGKEETPPPNDLLDFSPKTRIQPL